MVGVLLEVMYMHLSRVRCCIAKTILNMSGGSLFMENLNF